MLILSYSECDLCCLLEFSVQFGKFLVIRSFNNLLFRSLETFFQFPTPTRHKLKFFSQMFALRRPLFSSRFFSSVAKNMEKHCVVPDVVDVAPEVVAEVSSGNVKFDNLKNHLRCPTPVESRLTLVMS